LVLVILMIS